MMHVLFGVLPGAGYHGKAPLRVCTQPRSIPPPGATPQGTHGSLLGAPTCACPLGLMVGSRGGRRRRKPLSWGIPMGKYTHSSSSSPKVHLQANRKDFRWPGLMKTQEPKLIRTPLPERQNCPQLRAQLEERCHNPFFIWSLFLVALKAEPAVCPQSQGPAWQHHHPSEALADGTHPPPSTHIRSLAFLCCSFLPCFPTCR